MKESKKEKKIKVDKSTATLAKSAVPEMPKVDNTVKPTFIPTGRMKISIIVNVAGRGVDEDGKEILGNIPSGEQGFFDYYNVQSPKILEKEVTRNMKKLVKDAIKRLQGLANF